MTREEAKAIIRKEYLCVDRDCDIERSCGRCDLMMPSKEPILEAYKMAMQALQFDIYQWADEHFLELVDKDVWADAKRALQAQALSQELSGDLISREAINKLRRYNLIGGMSTVSLEDINKLPSVKQEPCDDAISRQAVLDLLEDTNNGWVINEVLQLPSVTQKFDNKYRKEAKRWKNKWLKSQKSGHWKRISMDRYTTHAQYWYECDRCGEHNLGNTDYCPYCGARMESEDE